MQNHVIFRLLADRYIEPPVPSGSGEAIGIIFPSREFKGLKNVVERMRSVNEWMRLTTCRGGSGGNGGCDGEIDGSGSGELQLLVEKTELVRIKTTYPKLGLATTSEESDGSGAATADSGSQAATTEASSTPASASATVEVKKLLRVLQSLSSSDLRIQNAIVCIAPNSMVILKIFLPDTEMQSYVVYCLPAIMLPDD